MKAKITVSLVELLLTHGAAVGVGLLLKTHLTWGIIAALGLVVVILFRALKRRGKTDG